MMRCFEEGWKYTSNPWGIHKIQVDFLRKNFIVAIRVTIVWDTGVSFFGCSVAAHFCPRRVAPGRSRCGTYCWKLIAQGFFIALYKPCNLLYKYKFMLSGVLYRWNHHIITLYVKCLIIIQDLITSIMVQVPLHLGWYLGSGCCNLHLHCSM